MRHVWLLYTLDIQCCLIPETFEHEGHNTSSSLVGVVLTKLALLVAKLLVCTSFALIAMCSTCVLDVQLFHS